MLKRLINWLSRKRAPFSYAITPNAGAAEFIVEAHKFTLDRAGRLLFWKRGWLFQRVIAIVDNGKWQRVREGITLKDLEE